MSEIMVQYIRCRSTIRKTCVRTSLSRMVVETETPRSSVRGRLGESSWMGKCLSLHREGALFLSVFVEDVKMADKKHNVKPILKKVRKKSGSNNFTPLLNQENLGCTRRECQTNTRIVEDNQHRLGTLMSSGTVNPPDGSGDPVIMLYLCSMTCKDMPKHASKCTVYQLTR